LATRDETLEKSAVLFWRGKAFSHKRKCLAGKVKKATVNKKEDKNQDRKKSPKEINSSKGGGQL